ncbi:hypothetical protein ACHAQH_007727 [Verticillium albo-atrum]
MPNVMDPSSSSSNPRRPPLGPRHVVQHPAYSYLSIYVPPTTSGQARGYKIRVLTLQPAGLDDDIQVTLRTVDLYSRPTSEYEALSYVWGDETDLTSVTVDNDFSIKVTANLDVALRHLRRQDKPRTLWIDAICINQQDDKERGQQVSQMGDIYQRTNRVVAWLGPECDNSAAAVGLFKWLSQYIYADRSDFRLTLVPEVKSWSALRESFAINAAASTAGRLGPALEAVFLRP